MQDWSGLLHEVKQRKKIKPAVKKIPYRSNQKFFLGEPFRDVYLTRREAQVALCLLRGSSFLDAGNCLSISGRTVEFYVTNMRKKLVCNNRWQLVQCLRGCAQIQKLFDGMS